MCPSFFSLQFLILTLSFLLLFPFLLPPPPSSHRPLHPLLPIFSSLSILVNIVSGNPEPILYIDGPSFYCNPSMQPVFSKVTCKHIFIDWWCSVKSICIIVSVRLVFVLSVCDVDYHVCITKLYLYLIFRAMLSDMLSCSTLNCPSTLFDFIYRWNFLFSTVSDKKLPIW